jgi:hypothetical protein
MHHLKRERTRGPGRPSIRQGRFGQWLLDNRLDRDRVAAALGINRRHVDHIAREDRRPSLELAVKIERLTGGDILASYFSRIPSRRR